MATGVTERQLTDFEQEVLEILQLEGPITYNRRGRPIAHLFGYSSEQTEELMRALRELTRCGLIVARSDGRSLLDKKGRVWRGGSVEVTYSAC